MLFLAETSTRADGNMAFRYGDHDTVLQNRARFLAKLSLVTERCVVMESEHKDIVAIVDEKTPAEHFGPEASLPADTLITQLPNTPLLLTTADCQPISLFDPVTQTVALIHLSRHTFCHDLLEKTFTALRDLSVKTENLEVVIGPHIKKDSYSFPLPLQSVEPKLAPYISEQNGRAYIDLTTATLDVLREAGVIQSNLTVSPIDTYQNTDYFSHVREVQSNEPEGRLATVAVVSTT